MTDTHSSRREFVALLGGGTAALLTGACASAASTATASPSPAPAQSRSSWDDSWTARLGRHRTVFDVADLDANPGIGQVIPILDAWHEVHGTTDRDMGYVGVIRHMAVSMLLTDDMWAKYDLAPDIKHMDPKTKLPYKRNPFAPLLAMVQRRGVLLLGCSSAMTGLAGMLAQRAKAEAPAVTQEVQANLMPGVIMQPNGLYALTRAQDVGCGYMR
ncbi:MAG: hypothetical protein JWO05_3650 [Gemmatimonadetes bacterium]|nr:hypothetical protein [Gemmatimonadota bacterium]